jgi:large subunit ribosomal protein L3
MGARKHSQPRRGSLAYSPRGRAKSMEARIRAWPEINSEEPRILAHCGFKAGCVQIVSIDDRDKTPNAGKQLVSLGTVLVTPPVTILGIRGYSKDVDGAHAEFDVYAKDIPKNIAKEITLKSKEGAIEEAEKHLKRIKEIFAVVAVSPRAAGLEQKKPYVFEALVRGGDIQKQSR